MAGALCMGASEVLNLVLKIFNLSGQTLHKETPYYLPTNLVKPYKRRHLTTYQPIWSNLTKGDTLLPTNLSNYS